MLKLIVCISCIFLFSAQDFFRRAFLGQTLMAFTCRLRDLTYIAQSQ